MTELSYAAFCYIYFKQMFVLVWSDFEVQNKRLFI